MRARKELGPTSADIVPLEIFTESQPTNLTEPRSNRSSHSHGAKNDRFSKTDDGRLSWKYQKRVDQRYSEGESRDEDRFQEILPLAMVIAHAYRNIPGSTVDELRSEARLAAWDAAHAFQPGEGRYFEPFARRVINNRLTDLFRKEKTFRSVVRVTLDAPISEDSDDTSGTQAPSRENRQGVDLVCIREANTLLTELIDELPESHREIISAYMAGQSGSDIARSIGVTKQSISAIRSKALAALRKKFSELGIQDSTQLLARGPYQEPTLEELLDCAANKPIDNLSADNLLNALLPEP